MKHSCKVGWENHDSGFCPLDVSIALMAMPLSGCLSHGVGARACIVLYWD